MSKRQKTERVETDVVDNDTEAIMLRNTVHPKNLVFFDIETTGLPHTRGFNVYYPYSDTSKYDSSRIVQIAIVVQNVKGELQKYNYIVNSSVTITNSAFHGITTELANAHGVKLTEIVPFLEQIFTNCKLLIAHNIQFDKHILLSELHRIGERKLCTMLEQLPTFDTCTGTTHLVKIKMGKTFKAPKLNELHKWLFGNEAIHLHNAVNDTDVLVKIYNELVSRQLIQAGST